MIHEKPKIGDVFRCPVCGKDDVVKKTHEEMVALYEIMYGTEFNMHDPRVVMMCDDCGMMCSREAAHYVKE